MTSTCDSIEGGNQSTCWVKRPMWWVGSSLCWPGHPCCSCVPSARPFGELEHQHIEVQFFDSRPSSCQVRTANNIAILSCWSRMPCHVLPDHTLVPITFPTQITFLLFMDAPIPCPGDHALQDRIHSRSIIARLRIDLCTHCPVGQEVHIITRHLTAHGSMVLHRRVFP